MVVVEIDIVECERVAVQPSVHIKERFLPVGWCMFQERAVDILFSSRLP